METHKLTTRTKDNGSNKSLLSKGLIPGIIYGKGTEPTRVAFEYLILKQLMQSKSFYTKIINIDIEGKTEKVLPKILQYHPITDKVIHFDLLRVQENTKVTVEVPVEFLNQDISPGLKKGGVLNIVRRTGSIDDFLYLEKLIPQRDHVSKQVYFKLWNNWRKELEISVV